MATAEETKPVVPPVQQRQQTAARVEEPVDDSGQVKRFAEVGKLVIEIRKRENDRTLFHQCLKELGSWGGQLVQSDMDPAIPAVLRPYIDATKLQELGRRVNSGESLTAMTERLNQLLGRF